MKKLILLLVVVIIGIGVYNYYTTPPDPEQAKNKAQSTPSGVIRFYFTAAIDSDTITMASVCDEKGKGTPAWVVRDIEEAERDSNSNFVGDMTFLRGGTVHNRQADKTVILMSDSQDIVGKYLIRCVQGDDDLWYINYISSL